MEGNKVTMGQMIIQMIQGDQLSITEESEILGILEERQRKREEEKMGRCLAGVIESVLTEKVREGKIKAASKKRYHPIYKRCFVETIIGNMDASELTEALIKEIIIDAHETLGTSRNDMLYFMGLLQIGLNKMSEEGLLNFMPNKKLFITFAEAEKETNYRDNPYSIEEMEDLMAWVERNPDDVRGLAVGLWLSGGISPEEIIDLKKECLEDSGATSAGELTTIKRPGSDRYLRLTSVRKRILDAALQIQSNNGMEYVFMVEKEHRWRKLTKKSLQIKLYYICEDLGIKYKAFHCNDVILTRF